MPENTRSRSGLSSSGDSGERQPLLTAPGREALSSLDVCVPGTASGTKPSGWHGYEGNGNILSFPPTANKLEPEKNGSALIRIVTQHLNKIINHYLNLSDVQAQSPENHENIYKMFNHIVTLANQFNLNSNRFCKPSLSGIAQLAPTGISQTVNEELHLYMEGFDALIKRSEFPLSWKFAIAGAASRAREGCGSPCDSIKGACQKCCTASKTCGLVCINITGACPVCTKPCNAPISQNTCAKLTYNHIILILAVLLVFIALIATGQFAGNPPSPSPNPYCLPSDLGNPTLAIDWLNKTARENNVTTVENLIHLCTDVASRVDGYCHGANVNPLWIISYFLEYLKVNCPS